jgi:cellulose synthase/poly-beta-1,6-N-acetylglucosamine synthase-like glycosyltransferase
MILTRPQTPAEFAIKLFSADLFPVTSSHAGKVKQSPRPTRRLYARIRSSNAKFRRAPRPDGSVLPFQFSIFPAWFLPAPGLSSLQGHDGEVKFHIILEPLILGALPESLLPGLGLILCLVILAILFIIPRVNAEFERLANRARKGKGKVE